MNLFHGVFNPKRAAPFVLGVVLAGCQTAPRSGPAPAPQASSPAPAPNRVVLKLYSGSSTGLVVGGGSPDANPGQQLPGLSFDANPGLPQTYVWAFTPDSMILDGDCHVITRTAAINIANSPHANAAIFVQTTASGGQAAAVKVQVAPGTPTGCPAGAAS